MLLEFNFRIGEVHRKTIFPSLGIFAYRFRVSRESSRGKSGGANKKKRYDGFLEWPPGQGAVETRLPKPLSAIQPYALAIVSVLLALGGALLTEYFHMRDVEVPLFLFAVAVSAWFGGTGAAALALLLSAASFDYFFTEPLHTLYVSSSDLPYFTVFTTFACLVSWFSTVRRRVEEELRQARDKLQIEVVERTQQASLLNLTHDSIFVRDMDFVITYWNRGAQELYGWTPEEAIGKRSNDLLQTVFPAPMDEIRAVLERTGRWDGELKRKKADGTYVVVASRWSLRRDEHQRPAAILETNNDISERKRREQEISALNLELGKRSAALEASNKELEAFAYSVSHDLRAPLRHMSGFTQLLQKSTVSVLNEKSQRYVAIIQESAKRMGNLIDDLLAFSRIGRAEAHNAQVNLDQLVLEALTEVRQVTEERKIVWKVGPLPAWYGDRSMLRLAFVNLISNAVKFTRTRPRAEIEIGCKDNKEDHIVVYVRDNGVGFDMKYVNKLFGVFQRLHPTEAFEGTGIGLATVQRIVHRHGGSIWAEGLVDQGATFYFSLSKPQEANT
jgi:PAS domain S-box-containing protein